MTAAEEHAAVRAALLRLGSTFVYTEPLLVGTYCHQPIRIVIGRPASTGRPVAPVRAPAAAPSNRPSALAFALSGQTPPELAPSRKEPEPAAPAPIQPPAPAQTSFDIVRHVLTLSDAVPELLPAPTPSSPSEALVADLESRGHRVLVRDGKLFISEASRLTPEDRTAIQTLKPQLLALAEPWPVPKETSLAVFLGTAPAPIVNNWKAEPPPENLPDEIILNFATNGLDWARGAKPVGVTVSTLDGQLTRFLPFAFEGGGNLDEAVVKRWFQEKIKGKKITNAKTKFECHMARVWGVDLEEQGCTFSDIHHTAALLDDHRKRFSLDILAADYLPNEQAVARVDERRHHEHYPAEVAERELYTARLVGRLREVMYPQIDAQDLRAVHDLEDRVIPTVVEMEKNGAPIDMELLEQYGAECTRKHEELIREVSREAGFAFEHTAAGWKRLIESLGLTPPDSFSEAVLNEVDHPLIRKGQRAAQYASLNSKIFNAYPEHIVDGILRYNINQLVSDEGGTVSGRFSIGLVQQVPNADNHKAAFGDDLFPRRLFIAGRGAELLEADAAQIEFRLLVHYSGNEKLLQAYRDDPKMSFHKEMQKMLITYKPDMLYIHTKAYNFAEQYGAKSIKLAIMMGFITEREGDEIRAAKRWNDPRLDLIHGIEAAYKQAHPEAGELLDYAGHLAKPKCDNYCRPSDKLHRSGVKHRGFVKTMFGRRSRFPTAYKTYIGLNRVLQGTGADIMKIKLVELHEARKQTGLVMRITNHDAVIGDAGEGTLSKVEEILNRQSVPTRVPILWEIGVGQSWADCK